MVLVAIINSIMIEKKVKYTDIQLLRKSAGL
jgi:hypothetical protein